MILAIDLGSTSFKAGLFDKDMTCLGRASRLLHYQCDSGDRMELCAEEVTSAFREAAAGAVDDAGVRADQVCSIGITSQAQTFAVVDAGGQPKTRFISWQGMRAEDSCRALKEEDKLSDFGDHCSFSECPAGLQICKIRNLRDTEPELVEKTDRILNLPTFFMERSTGTVVIDDNLAAMSGLYSLRLQDWWPAALEACGLTRKQMPAVAPVATVGGITGAGASELGLPGGVPVVMCGNDQTAGAYGADIHRTGDVLITLGTAQVAYVCTRQLDPPSDVIVRGPYPDGLYYRMAADSCGCNKLDWARTVIAGCETNAEFFEQAAKAKAGSEGLIFDAGLAYGGAWKNIGPDHGPPEFARSVLEALVGRMAGMAASLGVDMEKRRIQVAGGGSRHDLWVRMLSDSLGAEVTVTESSPLDGAAKMALAHST